MVLVSIRILCVLCLTSVVMILSSLPLALQAQFAPVTTAGRVTTAIQGDTAVPVAVTVSNFNEVGKFTLTLRFDTLKVRYVSASTNPSLTGMTATYTPPSGNTTGKLVLAWTGTSNVSLADGSSLAGLVFRYVNGTGLLTWAYSYGSVCQYYRYVNSTLTLLTDSPKNTYYMNGGISNRGAPVMHAPVISEPVAGPFSLPITVDEFTDIGGFTLYLEYDPAIITFLNTFTKNPAFDSNFLVGDQPGVDGKRWIVIQWYGYSLNLADGDTLCTLSFSYPAPTCEIGTLSWYDGGPTCAFSDGQSNTLIDMPQESYYLEGMVEPGLPSVWTGEAGSEWNNPANWDACGIPDPLRKAVIPDVSPNQFPVISSEVHCKSLVIQSGAILTISAQGEVVVGN